MKITYKMVKPMNVRSRLAVHFGQEALRQSSHSTQTVSE